jgi:hypothetical protein
MNPVEIEVYIIKVEFIPAVSSVSDIPNIPTNAILPVSLSGADAKNKVRMKLKVTAPDGTFAFNLTSDDTTKATVSPSTISVTTSGGSGTSADITVTGGTLSSSASDLVNITANMTSPGSGCSCTEDFVRYKFVSEMAYWGAWSATYSANIKSAGHAFDGDDYAVATTAMSGLTVDGYEAPTEDNIPNADVLTQYSTGDGLFTGGSGADYSQLRFNDSGGTVASSHKSNRGLDKLVAYSKTASNWQRLEDSLTTDDWSDGPPLLSSGDTSDELAVVSGTFWRQGGDTGNSRLTADGGAISDAPNPPNDRTKCHFVWLPNNKGSEKHLDQAIEAQVDHDLGKVQVYTDPVGVFPGEVAIDLNVARTFGFNGYAYAESSETSLALAIGSHIDLPDSLQMILKLALPADESGASMTVGAANLALLRMKDDYWYDSSDESVKQWTSTVDRQHTTSGNPTHFKAVADAPVFGIFPTIKEVIVAEPPATVSAKIGLPMVFRVNTSAVGTLSSGATSLLIRSGVTSGSQKNRGDGYSRGLSTFSEVTVAEEGDYRVVALVGTYY